jgi:hypothetical protein
MRALRGGEIDELLAADLVARLATIDDAPHLPKAVEPQPD